MTIVNENGMFAILHPILSLNSENNAMPLFTEHPIGCATGQDIVWCDIMWKA